MCASEISQKEAYIDSAIINAMMPRITVTVTVLILCCMDQVA